ncbi:MAG: hypothetical protein H6757_00055 [Candidatus Omnitrophica bacterium]|nr:hypothetical protein [Candidatus Omnitrophota bacterium]
MSALLYQKIGFVAGVVLPFFNIPMIIRMVQRKSSDDFSLIWLLGVWICFVLMLPSALISEDFVFKAFGIMNITFFSCVVVIALKYRIQKREKK